jgi:hypothetical protein
MRPITPCGLTYPPSSKLEGLFLANLGQGTSVSVTIACQINNKIFGPRSQSLSSYTIV